MNYTANIAQNRALDAVRTGWGGLRNDFRTMDWVEIANQSNFGFDVFNQLVAI